MQTDSPVPPAATQDGFATRPLLANPAAERRRLEARAAWQEPDDPNAGLDPGDARRRTARPVVLVDLDLPFSAVFTLYVQFAIIQVLVAAVAVLLLFVAGVL